MEGWESSERQAADGAVESGQRVRLQARVVEVSIAGAKHLDGAYWAEVERVTRRLVRARASGTSLELRLFGRRPALLRFGAPRLQASRDLVACRYPIDGGWLARRAAGEITLAQVVGPPTVLRSTIRGFHPRLAPRDGEPDSTGALYTQVQSRIHVAISRRYFRRLIEEARR